MTDKQVLETAISRAIDGGWQVFGEPSMKVARVFEANAPRGWGEYEVYIGPDGNRPYYICTHSALIYNHDFAKALWDVDKEWNIAECEIEDGTGYSGYDIPYWQGMLQQMVISPDPIKYLAAHMPAKEQE